MKRLFLLLPFLVGATIDHGTHDVTPRCPENPCTTYRFAPFCKDVNRDDICDGYTFQTWTKDSAISTLNAACVAGDNADAEPDINPIYSWSGTIGSTAIASSGLSINSSTGAITGTPTVEGAVNVIVTCSNDLGSRTDTLAGVVNESPSTPGTVYYVGSGGNDSNSGTSHAQRWLTLAKVNSTVTAVGADVYLLDSTVFEDQQLVVDWGGTASDWAVIGTYYWNGSTEVVGVNVAKAIIDGTYEDSCSVTRGGTGTCPVNTSSAVPTTQYQGLIDVRAEYVEIQDLQIENSSGLGINLERVSGLVGRSNFRVHDNLVTKIASTGILGNRSRYCHIHSNEISLHNLSGNKADLVTGDHGNGIHLTFQNETLPPPSYCIIENNDVHQGYGEGIGFGNAEYYIVRGNRVGNHTDVNLYCNDCANAIYEKNITYGGSPKSSTTPAEQGIFITNEDYQIAWAQGPKNITIRDNLVVYSTTGIRVALSNSSRDAGHTLDDIRIYGNTVVDWTTAAIAVASLPAANVAGVDVRNNLSYRSTGSVAPCSAPTDADITMDYNLWPSTPESDCVGSNDVVNSEPLLTGTGWTSKVTFATKPTIADSVLQSGSPALAEGDDLDTTIIDTADYPLYTEITYPTSTFDTKETVYDINGDARHAMTPDIGAREKP